VSASIKESLPDHSSSSGGASVLKDVFLLDGSVAMAAIDDLADDPADDPVDGVVVSVGEIIGDTITAAEVAVSNCVVVPDGVRGPHQILSFPFPFNLCATFSM
jgi:hypothetical protein